MRCALQALNCIQDSHLSQHLTLSISLNCQACTAGEHSAALLQRNCAKGADNAV